MKQGVLRFRQVHLDFHTAAAVPEVGAQFDKEKWQRTLQDAAVNSITCFSKCHQGWNYHPTKVGKIHPSLNFDLLRAQFDACKEIDINVPIYISAGFDDVAYAAHPDWRDVTPTGPFGPKPLEPGYKLLDFHSPYLDYLCAQIEEVVRLFPECNGIFLDIITQIGGVGVWSLKYMEAQGLDPEREGDRVKSRQDALNQYYERTTAAAKSLRADMPVFHNSGHITRGDYSVLRYQTHLELESLPTGGWGYDHFPESAKYVSNLNFDFLGMTGKFHTTWGEFGGYKHPNALRYECAAMLAVGARCSIGDQLHPSGMLDESTYAMIGTAFREVAAKEPWCQGAVQVCDVGVLSSESEGLAHSRQSGADTGATRILLEEHILFTIVDRKMDFSGFRLLVLPDDILLDDALVTKIHSYLGQGGRLLLTGKSGLHRNGQGFALDIGAEWKGESTLSPDFVLLAPEFRPDFLKSPLVMYFPSQRLVATKGRSVGKVFDPYFNRTYRHYFSQHAPPRLEESGFDAGVINGNIAYLAHPVFSIYRGYGAVALKKYIAAIVHAMVPEPTVSLEVYPSTARMTLTRQEAEKRWVLHFLYANTIARGGQMFLPGGNVTATSTIEVIEELQELPATRVSVRLPRPLRAVTLEPGAKALAFLQKDGVIEFALPAFTCHQMVALSE